MISSMTGYGRGEASNKEITATVEIRSVNSRFLEVNSRLPRTLILRENDIKEYIRQKLSRGKINVNITIEHVSDGEVPVTIDKSAAKAYYKLLNELRRTVRMKEKVSLDHLLKFSDIIKAEEVEDASEQEWKFVVKALESAIDELNLMRMKEGAELKKDFLKRLLLMEEKVNEIENLSRARLPEERQRLIERVRQVIDEEKIDPARLELEIILLADKMDVTEECVRFRSHVKFFTEALNGADSAGRKLNFLIQEMNREINTIGSKSSDTVISHTVVKVKEELERIREQLQNIE
ncbi:MAG: YicC/YloC family endoribonuclease [Bacteroidota bacterium]